MRVICLLSSTVFFLCAIAQSSEPRIVAPSQSAQDTAESLVAEVYKRDYDNAKSRVQKVDLAKKLLREAEMTVNDDAGRYVLFRVARDIAAQQGDILVALDAIRRMTADFEVDHLRMQIDVSATAVKATDSPKEHRAIAGTLIPIVNAAIQDDRYEEASELCALITPSARKGGDVSQISCLTERAKEIEELQSDFAKVKTALNILEIRPLDSEANFVVGRFQCVSKGEWDVGVLKLALGTDGPLKQLALLEIERNRDPIEIGDACWKIAESFEIPREKQSLLRHASNWYNQSLSSLTGLQRSKILKRQTDTDELMTASNAWIATRPKGNLLPDIAATYSREWPSRVITNSIGMKLVWCPPGKFKMGTPAHELGHQENEKQVEVELSSGFWIGQYEVTQGQFEKVMNAAPWKGQEWVLEGQDVAATYVSKDDALKFCRKLTDLERAEGRLGTDDYYSLPSEAQWEYACRGGTTSAYSFGDNVNILGDFGWIRSNAYDLNKRHSFPVGQKKSNPRGLYDMHGNVWEWCRDGNGQQLPGGIDPEVNSHLCVLRGGSWLDDAELARAGYRGNYSPGHRNWCCGFRVSANISKKLAKQMLRPSEKSKLTSSSEVAVDSIRLNGKDHSSRKERNDNALRLALVWAPPGKFKMGSPMNENGRQQNEEQVDVELTQGFWIGKFEITQAEFEKVMEITPWKGKEFVAVGPDIAASYVSHDDAMLFCQKLTQSERQSGRIGTEDQYTLPTEAQWEYCCRAGTQTSYGFGTDDSQLEEYAWFLKNTVDRNEAYTHAVGKKKPNALGLYDMHGNVWEWCRDWHFEKLPGGRDPEVKSGERLTLRGGSWDYPSSLLRSATRNYNVHDFRFHTCGFRIVLRQASASVQTVSEAAPSKSSTVTNSIGMKLTMIREGQFTMGNPEPKAAISEANVSDPTEAEKPAHPVGITRPLYFGVYEVTKGQFAEFVKDTGYKTDAEKHEKGNWGYDKKTKGFVENKEFNWRNTGWVQDDKFPVCFISWNDANAFCSWLSLKENRTYRLPTEAEWEYACRGGSTTVFSSGDEPSSLLGFANVRDASYEASFPKSDFSVEPKVMFDDGWPFTAPIGSFRPNNFGLFDMHGNVMEWCQDSFDSKAYTMRSGITFDPLVSVGSEQRKVARGGAWYRNHNGARSSNRYPLSAEFGDSTNGFRVVMEPNRPSPMPK